MYIKGNEVVCFEDNFFDSNITLDKNMYLGYKKEIRANSERSCLTDPSIAGIGGNILVALGLQSKLINAIPDQKVKKKHLQSKTDQMQLLSSGPFHWGFINCIHRERR